MIYLISLSKSNKKYKKLKAVFICNGARSTVHFGHSDFGDFTDHQDDLRKQNFLARSARIRDRDGNLTYKDPTSANFWAREILWNKPTIKESVTDLMNRGLLMRY